MEYLGLWEDAAMYEEQDEDGLLDVIPKTKKEIRQMIYEMKNQFWGETSESIDFEYELDEERVKYFNYVYRTFDDLEKTFIAAYDKRHGISEG